MVLAGPLSEDSSTNSQSASTTSSDLPIVGSSADFSRRLFHNFFNASVKALIRFSNRPFTDSHDSHRYSLNLCHVIIPTFLVVVIRNVRFSVVSYITDSKKSQQKISTHKNPKNLSETFRYFKMV